MSEYISLYVGCAGSGEIWTVELNLTDGELVPRQNLRLPGLIREGGSLPLALSPSGQRLYAASRGEPLFVATLDVGGDGQLTHRGNTPLDASMAYLSTDSAGRYLFTASYGDNLVSAHAIDNDGMVARHLQTIATEPHAHAILEAPGGGHVIASSLGGDRLYVFPLGNDSTPLGAPATVEFPAGTGPRHYVFNSEGNRLYVLGELDGSITTLSYDTASAAMESLQRVHISKGSHDGYWASDIHISPCGDFLYACERNSSLLTTFRINATTGELNYHAEHEIEQQPRGFAIDPTGQFLVAAGQKSGHIAAWRLQDGELQQTARLRVGDSPDWITFRQPR
ncbi:lactonase family protein [Halomonas cupida]|uniref:lactonase family protein n=1 Tax=Halomonas cupida TaxID=44933 RepID=UPI003A94578E